VFNTGKRLPLAGIYIDYRGQRCHKTGVRVSRACQGSDVMRTGDPFSDAPASHRFVYPAFECPLTYALFARAVRHYSSLADLETPSAVISKMLNQYPLLDPVGNFEPVMVGRRCRGGECGAVQAQPVWVWAGAVVSDYLQSAR